jgi:hypothetical protein
MENAIAVRKLKINISLISIFLLLILFFSPVSLFGKESGVISNNDLTPTIGSKEEQSILYSREPWRIGVTEVLLNIEDPQSDDYLVFDYLNTLIIEQLKLFNFHILNDDEVEYLIKQNGADLEHASASDYEIFSMVYSSSLAYLRDLDEGELSDTSLLGTITGEYIIESGRIPVNIVFNENEQSLPYINFRENVRSLVISRNLNLESIISCEIDKIGSVYIIRMYKISPQISDPIKLLEYSFTQNTMYSVSQKTLDALSAGVGGYRRSILKIETDISDLQVLIENTYYSINDLGLSVLPPGEYEITISSEKNNYNNKKVYILEPGKTTTVVPIIPAPVEKVFSLSIYPFNAIIVDESQMRVENPVEIGTRSSNQITLYAEAGGYISQNIVIIHENYDDNLYTFQLRPNWMSLDSEIYYGQLSFYKSLAASIMSLPATIIFYGLASEYNNPIYESAFGLSLAINFSLLLDTIISLVDYYNRTEVL